MTVVVTSIDITAEQLEARVDSNGYKCLCQAWSATGGTLKSRTATIELACESIRSSTDWMRGKRVLDLDKIFEWEPLRTDSVVGKSAELRCRPPSGNPYPKVSLITSEKDQDVHPNKQIIIW